MKRLLSSLLPLLFPLLAFAQQAADEAPVEHASPVTVVAFLALFFGGILAYAVFLWRKARGRNAEGVAGSATSD